MKTVKSDTSTLLLQSGIACPVCGSLVSSCLYRDIATTVLRCSECDFMFTAERAGDFRTDEATSDIASCYEWVTEIADSRVPLMVTRLEYLQRLTGVGDIGSVARTVLEVGYGGGAFARACVSLGYSYTGLEPLLGNRFSPGREINQGGARVLPVRFEEYSTDERFDLVVMDNVLEHLEDPVASVRRATELLAPGGICWIQVPNEAWLVPKHRILSLLKTRRITFAGHVNMFTAGTLRSCFHRAGAQGVRIGYSSASDPVLTQLLLMRKPGLPLRALMALLRVSKADVVGRWAYWLDAYWIRARNETG